MDGENLKKKISRANLPSQRDVGLHVQIKPGAGGLSGAKARSWCPAAALTGTTELEAPQWKPVLYQFRRQRDWFPLEGSEGESVRLGHSGQEPWGPAPSTFHEGRRRQLLLSHWCPSLCEILEPPGHRRKHETCWVWWM